MVAAVVQKASELSADLIYVSNSIRIMCVLYLFLNCDYMCVWVHTVRKVSFDLSHSIMSETQKQNRTPTIKLVFAEYKHSQRQPPRSATNITKIKSK